MNTLYLLPASYPLGDDTPILLYVIIGVVALGLVVASIIMSKMGKEQSKKGKGEDKKR